MAKRDTTDFAFIALEVLGVNAMDLADFMEVSKRSIIRYSTGEMAVGADKQAQMDELVSLMTQAAKARGKRVASPSRGELDKLRQQYHSLKAKTSKKAYRLAVAKDYRNYVLRTEQLLIEIQPLIARKSANDPLVKLIQMARARNTKRLHTHSLEKITLMETGLAGQLAQLKAIERVLNRLDKGWKNR